MASYLEGYAPGVSIAIDGSRNSELEAAVVNLVVDDVLEGHSMFTLNLFDKLDLRSLEFKWLDCTLLDPARGKEISIIINYAGVSGAATKPLFTGYITALTTNFPSSGAPSLTVEGYDHSYRLQKTGSQKTFEKMNDYSDIVKRLAAQNSIGIGKVDNTNVKPKDRVIIDAEQSDYVYLRKLAERFGYDFFVRDKRLYFVDPSRTRQSPITLKWGRDLISFSPRMSATRVVSSVTVTGSSQQRDGDPIKAKASLADIGFLEAGARSAADLIKSSALKPAEISLHGYSVCSDQEAKAVAKAMMIRENNSFIEGTCETIGNPAIRAGSDVKIEGVGTRFEGVYRVRRARHSLGEGGYTLSLDLIRGGAKVGGSN
jgi:hypothetical protein